VLVGGKTSTPVVADLEGILLAPLPTLHSKRSRILSSEWTKAIFSLPKARIVLGKNPILFGDFSNGLRSQKTELTDCRDS
jgi:hypothetical protein